jgi:hypothetical protein
MEEPPGEKITKETDPDLQFWGSFEMQIPRGLAKQSIDIPSNC